MKWCFAGLLLLFVSCSNDEKSIKIKGSDTEVNLAVVVAESFHIHKPEISVSISGGGSGLGIASLLNGTADIANSSRRIKEEEMQLFQKKGIRIDSFVFAQDAIAFVISDELPIDSISIQHLSAILKGSYRNWKALTGIDKPINIYGRQSNSGTYDFVKEILGIEFTPYAKQMNGNAQILEAIKADHSGIGYVGSGYVTKDSGNGLKVLSIYSDNHPHAVSPLNREMIAAGKYYFQRPLFQYYKSSSFLKIKPFLDFEKTKEGQLIIQSSGYYPIL
ncbi:MAG: PstS family phosphate ABC transporter substrate-binding protein [Taibaiella sp.]|nr:PstS family phosphate ABC transporter substrate-binding protein [Taibaiella sp.]